MDFAKLHGLGNDFLIVGAGDAGGPAGSLGSLARQICDRHRGVGADGIIFYQPTVGDRDADISALIFNADGSRAEMSGNGVRCLAAFLLRSGQRKARELRIRTVSGIKTYVLQKQEGRVYTFESSMGRPVTDPVHIPALLSGPGPVLSHPLQVGSEELRVSLCSMGNPHCSIFSPDVNEFPVETLGPLIEHHKSFPNRTNVEFIQVMGQHRIRVRFWERGVGRTLASGTGSSAAVVAAILNNLAQSPVIIETELGTMSVRWRLGEELFLTGPAEFICSGVYVGDGENRAL
ncbi:MAG TPA: diaminopimelate epimerase [Acidobacteriota bacterium]|nr:diaminopimelate epimerase [Acidobacteriota bacterium]